MCSETLNTHISIRHTKHYSIKSSCLRLNEEYKKCSESAVRCDTSSHSTHSPQSQIRLVRNLYLEPVQHTCNMISARKVSSTFDRAYSSTLPRNVHRLSVFLHRAIHRENFHIRNPWSPFRLKGYSRRTLQGLTAGWLISDLPCL